MKFPSTLWAALPSKIEITDVPGEKLLYTYECSDEDEASPFLTRFIGQLEAGKTQTVADVKQVARQYPELIERPLNFDGIVTANPQAWAVFMNMIPVEIELEPL